MSSSMSLSSSPGLAYRLQQAMTFILALPPAYLGTVVLLVSAAALRPNLLSPFLLLLILRQAAPLGFAAIGQSLVMRCRSLDLSSGGVIAVVSYLLTSGVMPLPWPITLPLCILFGALVGAFNGFLIVQVRASAVIVTLAVSMILSGTVIALSQFHAVGDAPDILRSMGRARVAGVPLVPLLWIATLVPLALWLRRSAFGRVLDAVGANPRAAGLSGLPHLRVVFVAHVTSGAMSALSGLMLLGFVGVGNVKLGADLALNALAASILGGINFGSGRGGMLGPAVAAFMLVFLFNFLTSLGLGEPGKLMLQGTLIGAAALAYCLRHKDSAH